MPALSFMAHTARQPACSHDMKLLVDIREQHSLSLVGYGRPWMTMELKEAGLDVGERRVG